MKTRKITISAIIAAAYAALTIALMPITGEVRVAEALCVMPWFVPETAFGVFIGCLISNIFTGNIFDIIFGSLATLLAGLCTAKVKNKYLACLMPVIFNALIVGAVLAFGYGVGNYLITAATVAVSETIVMFLLGLPLLNILEKKEIFKDES